MYTSSNLHRAAIGEQFAAVDALLSSDAWNSAAPLPTLATS